MNEFMRKYQNKGRELVKIYEGKLSNLGTLEVFDLEVDLDGKILEIFENQKDESYAVTIGGEIFLLDEETLNGELIEDDYNLQLQMLVDNSEPIEIDPETEVTTDLTWE